MQCAVIEFARNVLNYKGAHSAEIDPNTKYPVIDLMPEQKDIDNMGGTMRLGAYPCKLLKGTNSEKLMVRRLYMKDIGIDMNLIMNIGVN